jgi:hypothetical protein
MKKFFFSIMIIFAINLTAVSCEADEDLVMETNSECGPGDNDSACYNAGGSDRK